MKLMSYNSSIIKTYAIIMVMLVGIMGISCTKALIGEAPTNVGTVRFTANTYTIENKTTDPLIVTLPLSLPLEEDATVLLTVDNASTIASTEYSISPAIPPSGLLISLPKGSTEVSFNVNSMNNFEGEKTLVLKLTAPTGGVTVSNTNATTVINVKGDPIIYPEIQTSALTAFAPTISGSTSPSQSYTVRGIKLTSNITITASDNYQISLDNTNFVTTLTLPFAAANAAPITVYAQFTALTGINQTVTGTITHSSGVVPSNTINVTGIEYGVALPGVLVMKDDFSYGSTTSTLDAVGAANWSVFSGTLNPIAYMPTGLSFTGYAGSNVGGAIVSANGSGSRKDYIRSFGTTISSGVVYQAQMINPSVGSTTGDFFAGMADAGNNYFNRITVKDDGTGKPSFGLGKAAGTVIFASGTYSYGTTYLVVTKYDFDSGTSTMYVLTSAPTKYEPPVPNAVNSSGTGPASLSKVFIRQNTNALTATYDGVRIATSWKDAVGL
ncbi:hypothetical protein EZJ43_00860 [Pedobacter changchengzhani]|uniref:Uncharacterized protein n=1 Tax=Pedobacter changchengzhani TaxID=2529274 RepID=A0A4R5MP99_9SPHI|nr:hypothetical protein [Pedobacter changchengzhani]TDG37677.1 hypothetical protein EZJ43_00860 [Pedobacter changchengzhani]